MQYGMRIRGYAPGCQPMNGLVKRMDDYTGRYHDILEYDRKLTEDEIEHYSLDLLRPTKTYETETKEVRAYGRTTNETAIYHNDPITGRRSCIGIATGVNKAATARIVKNRIEEHKEETK